MNYVAPWWLPGGNLQTIWPALYARRVFGPHPQYRRERWDTPDGDFIDVDFLVDEALPGERPVSPESAKPLLVLFHGLEGSSRSHYAEAFADFAREHGMAYAVPHFRGCSGELNRGPRAYHSGDFEEIGWILQRLRERQRNPEALSAAGPPQGARTPSGGSDPRSGGAWGPSSAAGPPQGARTPSGGSDGHAVPSVGAPMVVVGISLGGNALMCWAAEMGESARQVASAVASVCSPIDLAAGGWAIGRGFNRLVYTRMFLRSMKPKALQKLAQHPGLFDREALLAARDLYEFDNVFTAPLHGFKSTEDYWARASAKPRLARIRIPALVVNSRNDPFVPAWCLPHANEVGDHVTLWQPAHGGHVGFPHGPVPGHVRTMPDAVGGWLAQKIAA
jgi:uncharacterized protein